MLQKNKATAYAKCVDWANSLDADIYGTLTFGHYVKRRKGIVFKQVTIEEADRHARAFMNFVDRAFAGANYKRKGKKRLQRIVVRQGGKANTNGHIHFIASTKNIEGYTTDEVIEVMNWIWENKMKCTQKIKLRKRIEEVKNKEAVSGYIFKEWRQLGNDTISTKASYI